jgi:hypothetical protein
MDVILDGISAAYSEPEKDGIEFSIFLNWEDEELGFGNIRIIQDGEDIYIDSELMGKEFIKKVLCSLVDQAKIINHV